MHLFRGLFWQRSIQVWVTEAKERCQQKPFNLSQVNLSWWPLPDWRAAAAVQRRNAVESSPQCQTGPCRGSAKSLESTSRLQFTCDVLRSETFKYEANKMAHGTTGSGANHQTGTLYCKAWWWKSFLLHLFIESGCIAEASVNVAWLNLRLRSRLSLKLYLKIIFSRYRL